MISETKLKYVNYNIKKGSNFGKLYFLPKIHNKLTNVAGSGTPTKEVPEYLGFVRKPVMVDGWSYIRDTEDLLKISNI